MQNTCQIILTILLLHILCIADHALYAQSEVKEAGLDTVQISANRHEQLTPGHRTVEIDSVLLQEMAGQNLADILSDHSDLFIKSYGLGSLASSSLRGGGASHTAVNWNGFSLNSPMNGQLDFALIPAFFLDNILLQYGGSASLYGSGAVGGTIHLDNATHFQKTQKIGIHSQGGSFGDQMIGGDLIYAGRQAYSRTRLFRHQARNDFRLAGTDLRQHNASFLQTGLLQEAGMQLTDRQVLRLWLWHQQSDREIPPPLSSRQGFAAQQDRADRLAAVWKREGKTLLLQARMAYLRTQLHFQDSLAEIDAQNQDQTLMHEVEGEWKGAKGHSIRVGLTHMFQQARADGYGEHIPQQHRMAAFVAWHWTEPSDRWESVLSLRQEWMTDQPIPTVPSLSLRGRISAHLQARAQVGRTFRIPTFNDLYWSPGGNPDLVPEHGWHQEVGIQGEWGEGSLRFKSSAHVFSQTIDDWILWRPGPTYWFPENLRNVWSRGGEWTGRVEIQNNFWSLDLETAYSLTKATITKVDQLRDLSLGKQLIYTPQHQGRLSAFLKINRLSLRYVHQLTGRRYTSTDNAFSLPSYQLAHLFVNYQLSLYRFKAVGGIQLRNLWNQSYQVIKNRAMPGRNVLLSLNIYFTSTKSKSS